MLASSSFASVVRLDRSYEARAATACQRLRVVDADHNWLTSSGLRVTILVVERLVRQALLEALRDLVAEGELVDDLLDRLELIPLQVGVDRHHERSVLQQVAQRVIAGTGGPAVRSASPRALRRPRALTRDGEPAGEKSRRAAAVSREPRRGPEVF